MMTTEIHSSGDATNDPKRIGRRLQEARRALSKTQQELADHLGIARTTVTAMENGTRIIRPKELVSIAGYLGLSVGEFLRTPMEDDAFAIQLRSLRLHDREIQESVDRVSWEFQQLCEDYLELERLCGAPMPSRYPYLYSIEGAIPEERAEDVAQEERNRLSLGDGPVIGLREVLENDVGLRVFYIDMPSQVSAMYAHTNEMGGCIAVNHKHREERRRMSLGHEFGHFLTRRSEATVAIVERYQRRPEYERFAETFARAFLLPATGLRRRFREMRRARSGDFSPADLCILAHQYFVSVEALTLRLEELRLIPIGSWERLGHAGFRPDEAKSILGLQKRVVGDQVFPSRYVFLAKEALEQAYISEGQFARFLGLDRVTAREVAAGLIGLVPLDEAEESVADSPASPNAL